MAGKVVKRIVLFIQLQLVSPLSASSGLDEITDADVLRDATGQPFVAGSSLAGAMRAYLGKEKTEPCLMGYAGKAAGKDIGKMSSLFVSDFVFDTSTLVINVRDGVALEADKKVVMAGSKYDMEIIEAGAKGHFFLELTIRDTDNEAEMKEELALVIKGLNAGEIRLGSKKTRGFGQVKVIKLAEKLYDSKNWCQYADAYANVNWEQEPDKTSEWLSIAPDQEQMVHIEVPLRMPGGISIRQYAAKKGEPDFVHLTDNGKPVIPGSSMAGALRGRIRQIISQLQVSGQVLPAKTGDIIDTAFGYVNGKVAHTSLVIIGETVINNAKPLVMVRNGISRFESAAKSGALYKEKTYVDGTMTLHIWVRKNKTQDYCWIIGLLMLAIKDLQEGILAVGGQTAIGRGILLENGPVKIDGQEGKGDEYIANLVNNMRDALEEKGEGGSY